jgi:dolichyl-phosphate beta-glucosyltransferase
MAVMTTKNTPKYTIVMPAYREEVVIESSLVALCNQLKKDGLHAETELVVVTADPDSDKTAKIAKAHGKNFAYFSLIAPPTKVGKGRDVRLGMLAAKGEYILFTDADMATPPAHIAPAVRKLETNKADVVIGVRPLKRVHNSLSRRLRSVASNGLIRILAVPGVPDTQCGFKAFTRESAHRLFEPLETTQWGFDIEILVRARSAGYKIVTMEMSDWHDPKIGVMGLAGESDSQANWSTLKELLSVSKKRFTGYYKR